MGLFSRRERLGGEDQRTTYLVSTPYRYPDDIAELSGHEGGWGVVPHEGVDPQLCINGLFKAINGYDPGAKVVAASSGNAPAAAFEEQVRQVYAVGTYDPSFLLLPTACLPEDMLAYYRGGKLHELVEHSDPGVVICIGDESIGVRFGVPSHVLRDAFGNQPGKLARTEIPPGQFIRREINL